MNRPISEDVPQEILPNLYLSSWDATRNLEVKRRNSFPLTFLQRLKKCKISHIITVADNAPPLHPKVIIKIFFISSIIRLIINYRI